MAHRYQHQVFPLLISVNKTETKEKKKKVQSTMHTSQKQLTLWKHISPYHYYILLKYQSNHNNLPKTYQTKCYIHTQIYLILFHIKQIILFDGYTAKTSESLQLSSSIFDFKSKDHSFVNIHVLNMIRSGSKFISISSKMHLYSS